MQSYILKTVKIMAGTLASVVGDVMAYFLLAMHLADYTYAWFALTIAAVAVLIFIWSWVRY